MSSYTEIQFSITDSILRDILIAELSELDYEGFEEERGMLKAYIPAEKFDAATLDACVQPYALSYTKTVIGDRNWNEEWESNFRPVLVNDFCRIRAHFHPRAENVRYDIVITPKMSFGTGHHATTYLMIEAMAGLQWRDRHVFDFGTGTGVLAILAEQLGAGDVTAIDNDDWSIENARENLERNDCTKILLTKAERILVDKSFDIILANINRNVILQNLVPIQQHLSPKGVVLLSGLLEADEEIVLQRSQTVGLQLLSRSVRDSWLCLTMVNG